ncbi:hypothetical protein ABIB25_005747 [Nakamurella sp. UYEF19]|uniref:uridine kinase n=1 Tax=Nakamurella sp. UYEF19 TaxID=1756392 RepID=UPI003398C35C
MSSSEEVARLVAAAAPRAGSTVVVAIDGPSGAGKTTFAEQLRVALCALGRSCVVVHLDDLYPGWDGLDEVVPLTVAWILQPLASGRPPRYHRYDWNAGRYDDWHDVELPLLGDPVLIVEGVGAGSRACRPYLASIVWVHAPDALRMERGLDRDGEAYRPHWERWAGQESALFKRENTAAHADVTIDGTWPGNAGTAPPGDTSPI